MLGILDNNKLSLALSRKGIRSTLALSRLSGIHRNTLAPYLNGEKSIYSNAILDLAKFLELDPERLRVEDSTTPDLFINKLADDAHQTFANSYPELAIFLFGSRAKQKARKFSDYDLAVTNGLKPISAKDFLTMKEYVCNEADNFAWKIDLVNIDQAPTWFLSDLGSEPTRLLAGSSEAYNFFKGRAYECWKARQAESSTK